MTSVIRQNIREVTVDSMGEQNSSKKGPILSIFMTFVTQLWLFCNYPYASQISILSNVKIEIFS